MRDDFCAFILTHGRADRIITLNALKRCGYTGQIRIIIDDEDKQADEYRARYGDQVIQFSKAETEKTLDTYDNFGKRNTILHARNACFPIARELGFRYFIELDDDYRIFNYKFDAQRRYVEHPILDLDAVWSRMLEYFESCPFKTIAMAQGGDVLGGARCSNYASVTAKRKAMNSFICSTDRPLQFVGTMNEDVNTYCSGGLRGDLFFTTFGVELKQKASQSQAGGITELYKDAGTYVKSFYTVMATPSCVTITMPKHGLGRIHHLIDYKKMAPKILRESVKKHA